MPSKLEDIRATVTAQKSTYPTAYQMAIVDGVYDVGLLDQAMTQDLFGYVARETKPLNPMNSTPRLITENDFKETEQILAEESALHTALGHYYHLRPGMTSARACISFIQEKGRNSLPAQDLTKGLQISYETNPEAPRPYWGCTNIPPSNPST